MKMLATTKRLLFMVITIVMSITISAQEKGDMAVGGNLSYGTKNSFSNFGIAAKFQYNFTDALRFEPSATYFFKKDYTSMWDINANLHYLFPVAEKFIVYPLAGVTMVGWKVDVLGESYSDSKIGFNLGGGAQYNLTDALALSLEIKYQIVSDWDRPIFSLGIAYKF